MNELIERLRALAEANIAASNPLMLEAADALEAQAKRIAELESSLADREETVQVLGLKLAQVEAERDALKVDAGRLDYLISTENFIGWNRDGDACRVFTADKPEGDIAPVSGWSKFFDTGREAIDAAMKEQA